MNERSKEFVAKKKWEKSQLALFLSVIAVMLAAFIVLSMIGIMFMVAFLFVLGILSLYYMKNIFKAEYAYTISNKLTVEVLKSGGKRVPVYECFFSDMKYIGKYNSENEAKFANADETVKAATDVKDEEETYGALVERDGKKTLLLFTPNDMMLSEMEKHVECVIEK